MSYLEDMERQARMQSATLEKELLAKITTIYENAGKELMERFKNAPEGSATREMIKQYSLGLRQEIVDNIERYGVQNANAIMIPYAKQVVDMVGGGGAYKENELRDTLRDRISTLSFDSMLYITRGNIYKDNKTLSDRVWDSSAYAGGKVSDIIAQGLASNLSAKDIAKKLEQYVQPSKRKNSNTTGYKAEYNALRIARTTISHTATASMKQVAQVNPYVDKLRWYSVHSERSCMLCKDRDGKLYTPKDLPFDHPNGMCYHVAELSKSLDEMAKEIKAWANGGDNPKLDEWYKNEHSKDWQKEQEFKKAQPQKKAEQNQAKSYEQILAKHKNGFVGGRRNIEKELFAIPKANRDIEWAKTTYQQLVQNTIPDGKAPNAYYKRLVHMSEPMQLKFFRYQHQLKWGGTDPNDSTRAYFSPSEMKVFMDMSNELTSPKGPYVTYFHEYGHFIDKLMSTEDGKYGKVSYDIGTTLFKEFRSVNKEEFAKEYNSWVMKQGNEYGKSSGTQDIVSGLTLNDTKKYVAGYQHSNKYWNRWGTTQKDRAIDLGSEAFAHFVAMDSNPNARDYIIKKYFPESLELFNEIIRR